MKISTNSKISREKFIDARLLLEWTNRVLKNWNRYETQIEGFGTGVQYCLIFHHYHPQKINLHRLIRQPKFQPHFKRNLMILSDALKSVNLHEVTFDINKTAQLNYRENYLLLSKLYQAFNEKKSDPDVVLRPNHWGTLTPMKTAPRSCKFNQYTVEEIRNIVLDKGTDKEKVKQLKFLLSLPSEDNQEEEKDLLSEEGNTKLPVIIDDDN